MPVRNIGAQGASAGSIRASSPGILRRTLTVAIALALLAIAAAPLSAAAPRTQAAGGAPKAVIIVGPTGGTTAYFLQVAKQIADQAEAAGMDVRRIFHPKATAERVLANIQGAKFVLYLGHGNGWPSPYAPFQERTKNGFGLNAVEGGSVNKHTYYGANWIRSNVRLGANAVVMLIGACYASGNGETGMPIPKEDIAHQRVDNFASGFLGAGAGVVYAFGWQQKLNYVQQLMTTNKTFDEIFMTPSNGSPSGGVGWKDKHLASRRTPGAVNHLDPHPSHGYYRAASGWLDTKASAWRGSDGGDSVGAAPPPGAGQDTTPPSVPADFTATRGSGLTVNLNWSASTDDRAGTIRYRVLRNGTRIAQLDKTSYTDQLAAAGTYKYKVRALDAAGNLGAFTAVVTVSASESSASSTGPSVPGNLKARALGQRRVELTWQASTSANPGTIKYRILRNGVRIALVTTLMYVDRPATAGMYNYKIRAVDGARLKSGFTPVVTVKAVRGII
ncbi:hypothetical protein BH23CHL7_BH23CHL7_19120 [soil metagenome]